MGVDDIWLSDDENGYISGKELRVCAEHFQDEDILRYIKSHHIKGHECDFCNKFLFDGEEGETVKTITWDELMERIVPSIREFYDDPANGLAYESSEGGYFGNVYNSLELLTEVIELHADYEIIEEIANTLTGEAWTEAEFYGPSYLDHLNYTWDYFSEVVKYKIRYLFNEVVLEKEFHGDVDSPYLILKDIGRFLKEFKLFTKFPFGMDVLRKKSLLYRATQYHPKERKVRKCADIGSAPRQYAGANRFSPEGISIFYGAEDVETALLEIKDLDRKEDKIAVGCFKPERPLYLIDLRAIPRFGFFNTEHVKDIEPARFLQIFVENISKKLTKEDNHRIEYIPSQIVTEYLRYILSKEVDKRIDGIVYNSVQNPGKSCYAIFADHTMCNDEGEEDEDTLLVLQKGSIKKWKIVDL